MTVSNTTARKTSAGNGVTTPFPTVFEFEDESTLVVTQVVDATAVETIKTLTTDYTVSGGGGASGTVTMIVAPPTGETLVIERVEPFTQGADYTPNDPFPAEVNETALDKLTFLVQQVLDFTQRSIKLKKTTSLTDVVIPDPEVGKLLIGKSTMEFENKSIGDISATSITIPVSIADGGTNAITVAAARTSFLVAVSHERKTASYTAVAADRSKLIEFDSGSALSLNLTAAATLGSDWFLNVKNSGAGALTIDPDGSELIDDVATITLTQDEGAIIFCDASGFWSIKGASGAGKHTIWVPSAAMRPTVSNGCAALVDVATLAGRPDMQVLDFDTAADEHAQFQVAFPKSWDEGTFTFRGFWTTAGAVTTGVAIALQGVMVSDNDSISAPYGTAVVVTDDALGVAEDLMVTAESATVTPASAPAENDVAFFRVFRDVSDANDDMTQDMRLIGIQLFFTTDAGTDD